MDNETPRYAEWIPTAGGYVANGNVVSKSPIYENGKMKTVVDATTFGNVNPAQSAISKQNIKNIMNAQPSSNGVTTANAQGSGEDANSMMTGVGSLGSLNNNTATTSSPLATQAIKSPLTNIKPQDALAEINEKYLEAAARNDYKAMIDLLTEASTIDGVDRTTQINDLWKQRGLKVRTQDDAYSSSIQQIKDAITSTQVDSTLTPEEKTKKVANLQQQLAQLTNDQEAYRDMVGYDDQIARDKQVMEEQLKLDFDFAYGAGLNDINNGIIAGVNAMMNFQYNPYEDSALRIAQGYATSSVKEHMNSTGMYYSSMTQNAIAKAVGELVPVYEKMAKDEMRQNLSMLMNVGNYLMDLEQTQFNMWKSQIQLKWDANAEKRAQIKSAIDAGNARGYYTNEEAILLGVPGGTESSEARERAIKKQEEIEKEQRELDVQKALYEYKSDMDWAKEQERVKLETDEKIRYYNATTGATSKGGSNGNYAKVKWTDPETGAEYEYYVPMNGSQPSGLPGQNTPSEDTTLPESVKEAVNGYKDADGNYDIKKARTYVNSQAFKELPVEDQNAIVSDLFSNYYLANFAKYAEDFGEDFGKTNTAYKNAAKDLEEFAQLIDSAGMSPEKQSYMLNALYATLIDNITSAAEFDNIFADMGDKDIDREKGKDFAILDIIDRAKKSSNPIVRDVIALELETAAKETGLYAEKEAHDSSTMNSVGAIYANPITNPLLFGIGTGIQAGLKGGQYITDNYGKDIGNFIDNYSGISPAINILKYMRNKANTNTKEEAEEAMKEVINQTASETPTTNNGIGKYVGQAINTAKSKVNEAKENVSETVNKAKGKASETINKAKEKITSVINKK